MRELSLRGRRLLEVALVSSLAVGSAALGAVPATAADSPTDQPAVAKAATNVGLSGHDEELLTAARSAKEKTVTVILVADPGQTSDLGAQVEKLGGTVTKSSDKVGYVRATVPTGAVEKVAKLPALAAIDLNETVQLPTPEAASKTKAKVTATVAAPGPTTPAANPYMPTNETGSVDFKKKNPTWDGRG